MTARVQVLAVAVVASLGLAACGPGGATSQSQKPAAADQSKSAAAAEPAKAEHVFRGKVEAVDPGTKMLTVNGENVEGWMSAMTMSYTADKDDVFSKLKVGDQITAKVYDGDFKTLHDVQVVAPAEK